MKFKSLAVLLIAGSSLTCYGNTKSGQSIKAPGKTNSVNKSVIN